MSNGNHEIARQFFAALSAGQLPDALLTDDMQAWTVSSGEWWPKEKYQGGAKLLAAACPDGLTYSIVSLTAEDDRVVADVRSEGTLVNGEPFANVYLFLLTIRDGRIASVREFFDQKPVEQKLVPLLAEIMAKQAQA